MVRRFQLSRLGLAALFGLSILLMSGCNRTLSSETRSLRRELSADVVLLKPSKAGFVASSFGELERRIGEFHPQPVAFTPDLKKAAYVRFENDGGERRLIFSIRGRANPQGSFTIPIGKETETWRLRWASASGDRALITAGGRLFLVCVGMPSTVVVLAENVVDSDTSGGTVFVLSNVGGPQTLLRGALYECKLSISETIGIPETANGVVAISDGTAVVFRHSPDRLTKEDLRVVDFASKSVRSMPRQASEAVILDIVPLRQPEKILLIQWRPGEERVDGTMLTQLYAHGVRTGRSSLLWTNYDGEIVHRRDFFATDSSCSRC